MIFVVYVIAEVGVCEEWFDCLNVFDCDGEWLVGVFVVVDFY